jgi:hypothetical protein
MCNRLYHLRGLKQAKRRDFTVGVAGLPVVAEQDIEDVQVFVMPARWLRSCAAHKACGLHLYALAQCCTCLFHHLARQGCQRRLTRWHAASAYVIQSSGVRGFVQRTPGAPHESCRRNGVDVNRVRYAAQQLETRALKPSNSHQAFRV